jgi:hypothetical protein
MAGAEQATLEKVPGQLQHWARRDYRAAGEWLAGLDQGGLRDAAAAGYATTVAPYHPEAAAEWVATLPQGEARRKTAREVWSSWQGDREDRAAFAEREGIREP